MTLTSDLIASTRRHLYTGETRDERDRLAAAISSAGATTLSLEFSRAGVQDGAMLGIDLEDLYVWSVSGTTATVSRGENGSTAATHTSGSVIYVNPRHSAFSIFSAVNDEILSLSAEGLFRVRTVDLTLSAGTDAYNLTSVTDLIDVLSVEVEANDGTARWETLPRSLWSLRRDLPTGDFASGLSLTVNCGFANGATARVSYKAPYTVLATVSDNVLSVAGVHTEAHDILPLGAAARLAAGNEVSRNFFIQGDTRRAEEIGAGSRGANPRMLLALRQQRIEAEKARLYAKYPTTAR